MKSLALCLAAWFTLALSAAEPQPKVARFVGEFDVQLEERATGAGEWTTRAMTASGRAVIGGRYAELRGTFPLSGFERAIEMVLLWSFDPFQEEYRVAVLDDYAGLLDVFEQEQAEPLVLSNVKHGTFFSSKGGRRSFTRMAVSFTESGAIRIGVEGTLDEGKSWAPYMRMTLTPRQASVVEPSVYPEGNRGDVPDRAAIEKVLHQYVAAWLAGDADGVMRTLSADAVLVPHHGLPPVVGEKAIRAWWWPPNAPVTTIHSFVLTHAEIGGSSTFAFARGTQALEWTTGDQRSGNRGNHLTLLRKEADGKWRITHQMWGDPETN